MRGCHLLIVEGSAAVGKTTLCSELVRLVTSQKRVPSFFNFRQNFTYHPLNPDHPDCPVSDEDIKHHLTKFLEQIRSLSRPPSYLLMESLHWTLTLRPGLDDKQWLREYEKDLLALGARIVLLIADESTHRTQLKERSGSEFYTTYGQMYGNSEEEIIEYYLSEQNRFHKIADSTLLPVCILERTDPDYVEKAFKFWNGC